jgi:DNA modification methylase
MSTTAKADAVSVASLPTPYYQDDAVTLYCGDCREILPQLGRFDLLLTDPPYGIKRSGQKATFCADARHNRKQHIDLGWDDATPTESHLRSCFDITENQIIWGGNYFTSAIPASMGWVVWDKGQDFSTSDCELAFTSYQKALRRVVCNRGAIAREGALHPTQKPLSVIRFCIGYAGPDATTILDPFAGSCTTGVAAKLEGRKATLIELDERYCEIGANRLSQGVLF